MGHHAKPTSLRIFLVENHADTRESLKVYLEMLGHTVLCAATAEEALEAIPAADCDVLISDIGLPGRDGWELMQELRLLRPIYAVAMSGFGMNADHRRSKAAGYRHHFLKPFPPERLDEILEEAARESGKSG